MVFACLFFMNYLFVDLPECMHAVIPKPSQTMVHLNATLGTVNAQACMEVASKLFGFVIQGVQTNWWGLSCPAHCFSAGIPALFCTFIFGLTSGLLLAALFFIWTFGFVRATPSEPPLAPSNSLDRVRAYLNEPRQTSITRRRRGWAVLAIGWTSNLCQGQLFSFCGLCASSFSTAYQWSPCTFGFRAIFFLVSG